MMLRQQLLVLAAGALLHVNASPWIGNMVQETFMLPEEVREAQGIATSRGLFVFGGFINVFQSMHNRSFFHPFSQDKWDEKAKVPITGGITHCGIVHDSSTDTIFLVGGFQLPEGKKWPQGNSVADVWRYDINSDTWHFAAPLESPRGAGAAALWNGQLHFFGGSLLLPKHKFVDYDDHFVMDLTLPFNQQKWAKAKPLPFGRNHLGATVSHDKIYLFGGQLQSDEIKGNLDDTLRYDPVSDEYQTLRAMPVPLGHITSSILPHGSGIFVIGGTTNGVWATPSTAMYYDIVANSWCSISHQYFKGPTRISAIHDNKLYSMYLKRLHTGTIIMDSNVSNCYHGSNDSPAESTIVTSPAVFTESTIDSLEGIDNSASAITVAGVTSVNFNVSEWLEFFDVHPEFLTHSGAYEATTAFGKCLLFDGYDFKIQNDDIGWFFTNSTDECILQCSLDPDCTCVSQSYNRCYKKSVCGWTEVADGIRSGPCLKIQRANQYMPVAQTTATQSAQTQLSTALSTEATDAGVTPQVTLIRTQGTQITGVMVETSTRTQDGSDSVGASNSAVESLWDDFFGLFPELAASVFHSELSVPAMKCLTMQNQDFKGNDIAQFTVNNVAECAERCLLTTGCTCIALVQSTNTCYAKSQCAKPRTKNGTIGGPCIELKVDTPTIGNTASVHSGNQEWDGTSELTSTNGHISNSPVSSAPTSEAPTTTAPTTTAPTTTAPTTTAPTTAPTTTAPTTTAPTTSAPSHILHTTASTMASGSTGVQDTATWKGFLRWHPAFSTRKHVEISPLPPSKCIIFDGFTFAGNDLNGSAGITVNTESECVSHCIQDDKCRCVAMQGDLCFKKSACGATVRNQSFKAGPCATIRKTRAYCAAATCGSDCQRLGCGWSSWKMQCFPWGVTTDSELSLGMCSHVS